MTQPHLLQAKEAFLLEGNKVLATINAGAVGKTWCSQYYYKYILWDLLSE